MSDREIEAMAAQGTTVTETIEMPELKQPYQFRRLINFTEYSGAYVGHLIRRVCEEWVELKKQGSARWDVILYYTADSLDRRVTYEVFRSASESHQLLKFILPVLTGDEWRAHVGPGAFEPDSIHEGHPLSTYTLLPKVWDAVYQVLYGGSAPRGFTPALVPWERFGMTEWRDGKRSGRKPFVDFVPLRNHWSYRKSQLVPRHAPVVELMNGPSKVLNGHLTQSGEFRGPPPLIPVNSKNRR